MAHAHPSDGPYLPPHFSYARSQQPSPTIASTEPRPRPFTPPQQNCLTRRLQLRNAGFRGPNISARKVTPFTVASNPLQEQFALSHTTNDENTPRTAERRTLYGEDLPPSPVSILQEISNTSRRNHRSPQPSITTIFQDSTATKELDHTFTTSWYHEASNNPSPSPDEHTRYRTMKLREVSLNERAGPITQPKVPKKATERRKSRTRSRAGSFEATKYIEHLESELASLNTKLDAITSPTRTKAQSSKLRALTNQNRTMREELSEWEKRFDERVFDQTIERSELEKGLRSRIQALEEDAETKDLKIQELDKELEISRSKLRVMDSIESTNKSLERRVDVLTELLAQSPTRANSRPVALDNIDSTKRTPRPKSLLLPRIPPSPTSMRFSASYTADVDSWHTRQKASMSSTSIAETPEDEVLSPLELEPGSLSSSLYTAQPVARTFNAEDAFSSHFQSPSRPASTISTSSTYSSRGLPSTTSAYEDCKSTDRPRKMRRFPSGSCSLKPLILPATTAVTQCLPASAPAYSNYSTPFREFSNTSIDPTTAFLSNAVDASPFDTPTEPARRRSSTSWAQKQALDALEGRSHWPTGLADQEKSELASTPGGSDGVSSVADVYEANLALEPKRRSLQMELEQAQKDEMLSDMASPVITEALLASETTVKQLVPSARLVREPVLVHSGGQTCNREGLRQRSATLHTPFQTPSVHILAPSPARSLTNSARFPVKTLGMFSKLTGLVAAMRQDPSILARKILAHAWTTGSSRLGGLAWWLIGLIYRPGQRNDTSPADADAVEEDAPHDQHARQRRRSADARLARKRPSRDRSPDSSDPPSTQAEQPECARHTSASRSAASPPANCFRACDDCVEPPARRTWRLWLRFSLAIVLAVGLAVKDGPGALLEDGPLPRASSDRPLLREGKRSCERLGSCGDVGIALVGTPGWEGEEEGERLVYIEDEGGEGV
ncbi:hypothetical protein MMC26_000486 [Xylographa opegraphella]|nr:hypothetical protein [Xylographa opegraphella]